MIEFFGSVGGYLAKYEVMEHLTDDVVKKLVKYFNRALSPTIDSMVKYMPNQFNTEVISDLKLDLLSRGLDFCYKNKHRFNPDKSNGHTSFPYFANVLKSYVIHDLGKMRSDIEYRRKNLIPIHRERVINDLLGIPNPPEKNSWEIISI